MTSIEDEKDELIKRLKGRIRQLKAKIEEEKYDLGKLNFYVLNLDRLELQLMNVVVLEISTPVIN
jgi:hypothetical protein